MNENGNDEKRGRSCESPITRQDVRALANRVFGSGVQLLDYQVRPYSEERLGFLGAHRYLVVTVQKDGSPNKLSRAFFLKTVPCEMEQQVAIIEDCDAFYKEIHFYKLILPELMSSVKDFAWAPRCYLTKDDLIVTEDLKSRNYAMLDKFVDAGAARAALTALAGLHAASMLAEKRLGRKFSEVCPSRVLEERLFVRRGMPYEWYRTGVDAITSIARHLGLESSDRVAEVCDRVFEAISTSATRRNVICHGDTKSNNFMFDGSSCVLVDFQLVRYAPASTDLLQFFYLNTRREFRAKHEVELLGHYREALRETLRKSDGNTEELAPKLDEVLREYEEMRLVGVVTAVLYLPTDLIERKTCAEMTNSSEGFANTLFKERVNMLMDIMRRDELYKEVITEVVTEMIERSERFLAMPRVL